MSAKDAWAASDHLSHVDASAVALLANQRDDLQLVLDAIPAFVFYKDTNNRILRVNQAAADSLGVTPDEMANTPTARWYPDEAEAYFQDDLVVIASRQPKRGIVEPIESANEKRWIRTDKFPQFDLAGQVKGIVVIAQDITVQRQLEQQLFQAQKLESIGRLAGGVAHDFNNLLTTILGHLELARRTLPAQSAAIEHLDSVRLAAERSADLTAQLLAFARKQVLSPRVTDLNDLLRDADRLLRRVIGEDIEIVLSPWAGPLLVGVDIGQLSQVVINLALNARDAMPGGGRLRMETRQVVLDEARRAQHPEIPPGVYALLVVKDNGEGLSDEAKQHIFEPFFTTKEQGRGTGLGLATCYGIIKQVGGHVLVHSLRGQGTSFEIYLPPATAQPPTTHPPRSSADRISGVATVLLVEDDAALRNLAVRILVGRGYTVLSAADGREALDLVGARARDIHLLVTDVLMPGMGGPALAKSLLELNPDLRVLFVSGYSDQNLISDGVLRSDISLLQKPFSPDQLLARVEQALVASPLGA